MEKERRKQRSKIYSNNAREAHKRTLAYLKLSKAEYLKAIDLEPNKSEAQTIAELDKALELAEELEIAIKRAKTRLARLVTIT